MLSEEQRMTMMYTGLANCFHGERALGWSRSQLLSAINFFALPLFAAIESTDLRYLVAGIATIINVVWFGANRRSRRRINYWQSCLAKLEPPEPYLYVFRVFTGPDSQPITKPPMIYAVNLLAWTFVVIWMIAFGNTYSPGIISSLFNFLKERIVP